MRPLLVGEDNPHSRDPRHALYPYPKGCAGSRLAAILGLGVRDYLRRFDRVNLCSGRWLRSEARTRAAAILTGDHRPLVLLGAKVAECFGVTPFAPAAFSRCGRLYFLPHPSGRSRMWNEPGAVERARALLSELLD